MYKPCVALPAEAACTTRRAPSSAVRAVSAVKTLPASFIAVGIPEEEEEEGEPRFVLQKVGSRVLITI